MITALNIEEYDRRGLNWLFSLLWHNRIRVGHLYCDAAAVKSVVYEHRRGKISWTAIDRFVKSQRGKVLCPPGTDLPRESGYRRFESRELDRRLCENAALYLLGEVGNGHIQVVLIDPSGDSAGLCAYLIDFTDCLTIVTQNAGFYLAEADRILDERGAAIRVRSSFEGFYDADLIIAPDFPDDDIGCAPDAVVLSAGQPSRRQNAPVIYEYSFELPQKYRAVKPPFLDDAYFASAMYTLAGAHELGSSVFRRCSDGTTLHTRQSLCEQLRRRLDSRRETAEKTA